MRHGFVTRGVLHREKMIMPEFHIRIAGDELTFSAGHFITLEDGECERLHGHTYRVAVEVFGPLNDSRYVVDFVAVRNALKAIIAELDHRVLLPSQHSAIQVSSRAAAIEATFDDRRWVFPKDDCLLLPMANTTTESLAQYIGERLSVSLKSLDMASPNRLQIEIGEGTGCSAVCDVRV
jgi:6-pyruvoyltetrahydropterin/6-carboxytetrahydropterin synthase